MSTSFVIRFVDTVKFSLINLWKIIVIQRSHKFTGHFVVGKTTVKFIQSTKWYQKLELYF